MKISSLSVFFPAFNEESNITQTIEEAQSVLADLDIKPYEVIIVNDGSKDQTQEIAEGLAKKDPRIKVINHLTNLGYGEALKTGFYNSKYEWIVFTDSDGQFDFQEITRLIEKTDQADMVVGYRVNRQDHLMRIFNGKGWTFLANLLFGIGVRDVDCAFKLLKREIIEKIPKLESERGAMISPELLAKTKQAGFTIEQVPVSHHPRRSGKATGANLKVIVSSFVDMFKMWLKLRWSGF